MLKFKGSIIILTLTGVVFFILTTFIPSLLRATYTTSQNLTEETIQSRLAVTHLETPEPLKALYMTSCVASSQSWRENLKALIDLTELNAIVIDIKDSTGIVSFPNEFPHFRQDFNGLAKGCIVSDMSEFIQALHESGIYVIGRISVFQDPTYTKIFPEFAVKKRSDGEVWKDFKGLSFIDVGATPYWDYIVELSKKSYEIGFDEINYDYIRYPSDGNMQDTSYTWTPNQEQSSGTGQASSTQSSRLMTKPEVLKSFFEYLHDKMKDSGAKLSADLFGMTTTVESDMNIGQLLENALPYFDYIAPMVYPSHYPATWNGFANPAEHPYEVIKISMSSAVKREVAWNVGQSRASTTPSKLRPWLQDFNLGATYGPDKVRAQIQATYDVGLTSWMLWDAGNTYTKDALLVE